MLLRIKNLNFIPITAMAFFLAIILFIPVPFTLDPYRLPRWGFLILTSLFLFLLWTVTIIRSKKINLSFYQFDIWGLLFVLSLWLSYFLTFPISLISLTSIFGPLTFSSLFLIYFFVKTFIGSDQKNILLISLAALVFFTATVISNLNLFNQSARPFILDQQDGWYIAVGNLRNVKNAVFGIGPGNFPLALTQNRPPSLLTGSLSLLNLPFQSNFYFQILTEYGILSLGLFLVWIYKSYNYFLYKNYNRYILLLFLLFFAFFPPSLTALILFFLFMAVTNPQSSKTKTIDLKIPFLLMIVLFLSSIIYSLLSAYLLSRFYLAEIYYKKAFESQKNGVNIKTYDFITQSIKNNPYEPEFRVFLSKISLSSALSLMEKPGLSDDGQKILKSLLNQSIKEAQKAIEIQPMSSLLYFNLGEIYYNSMTKVFGAGDFALANYLNAAGLDPNNPNYRFALGKTYLSQKKYDLAQKQFEITIALDPSFLNAYYNLYYVLRQQGLYQQALWPLEQAKNLLPKNHPQFPQITQELKAFSDFVKEVTSSGNLKNLEPPPISTNPALLKQTFSQL